MASSPSEEAQEVEPPKRIYLQRHDNPNDTFDWTWCADRINDEDVSYLRDPDLRGISSDLVVALAGLDSLRLMIFSDEDEAVVLPQIRELKAALLRINSRIIEALP